jgi:hypothetical protein
VTNQLFTEDVHFDITVTGSCCDTNLSVCHVTVVCISGKHCVNLLLNYNLYLLI